MIAIKRALRPVADTPMSGEPLAEEVDVSFEFFPPGSDKAAVTLWETIENLAPLNPAYVSVTYGAGGTTRERTHSTVRRILQETDLTPAAHLTCVDAARDEVDAVARDYWDAGVRHLVALRGDPPKGDDRFVAHPDGYAHSADLVAGLKRVADFEISVAAYPEVHPEAKNAEADLDFLKRKIDAGASQAITQFFFEPEVFLRFRDRAQKAGIEVPIIPGIMPVYSFPKVKRFAEGCGASVPDWLGELFEGLDDDPDTGRLVAAGQTAELCRTLHAHGVDKFHFYTLNQAELVHAVCRLLGVHPGDNGENDKEAA